MSLYRLRDILYRYGEEVVLNFKSLEIQEKEVIGISGKNGSGKSTLLRLLAFLEKPTQGQILYRDSPTPRTQEIAILLPEVCLLSRNVKANLEYMFKIRHQAIDSKQIKEVLELVGLHCETFLKRQACELSSGEKQRVGLAQRLLLQPKVLLLDEPTNSLDSSGLEAFSNAIWWANQRFSTTIITISHDKKWLDQNANKRFKLHLGRLIVQNDTRLLSHNWNEAKNGEKYYEFGNGEVLHLAKSEALDIRQGILIAQEHILLFPQKEGYEATLIGIRTHPQNTKEVILECQIGKEVLQKIIPSSQAKDFTLFQKIQIGFDTQGILEANLNA